MRGGVVYKKTAVSLDEQLKVILSGSTFQYLQHGGYGFVFKVTFPGDSGFVNEKEEPVHEFILKVQSLDMQLEYHGITTIQIDVDDLTREINLQQTLYERALTTMGTAPCPAILCYDTITSNELDTYIDDFIYIDGDEIEPELYGEYRVAIILMEYVHAKDLTEVNLTVDMANQALRLYCMGIELGIDQNDPLPQNFLLKEDGTLTMIDFGYARQMPTISHTDKPTKQQRITSLIHAANENPAASPALKDALYFHNIKTEWFTKPKKTVLADYPNPFEAETVERCIHGMCRPSPILKKRPELKRTRPEPHAAHAPLAEPETKRVREDPVPELPAAFVAPAEPECKKGRCTVSGGKRVKHKSRNKVNEMGNRKRLYTRRKVSHHSQRRI